jgi:hypothetical protein
MLASYRGINKLLREAAVEDLKIYRNHLFINQEEVNTWLKYRILDSSLLFNDRSSCANGHVHDDPRSGRRPIDHLVARINHIDAKIIACLERELFSSAYSLIEALEVSPATVLSHLHNSLGTKNFHLCWVPHQLTDDLRQARVAKCGELLCALKVMQRIRFRHIIIGDESWFYLEYHHASQWSVSRDEVPQRVGAAIGTAKFMLRAIWGINGFHLPDLMPSQCRFNAQYFVEHVVVLLVQTVFLQGRTHHTPRQLPCSLLKSDGAVLHRDSAAAYSPPT